jgi:hypothetical protein
VRYAWQSGDISGAVGTRYLGRFWVTYSNTTTQVFPSSRYIEVVVT